MKKLSILLIVLVIAAVAGIGWLYLSARIDVRFEECIATDGVLQADYLDLVRESVASGAFVGTVFETGDIASADQYQFLSYTVSLNNHSFLDATVPEIRITPMLGDVLVIGDTEERLLPAGKKTELYLTLLTRRDMHSIREASVSWYVWGIPFTEKITLGN